MQASQRPTNAPNKQDSDEEESGPPILSIVTMVLRAPTRHRTLATTVAIVGIVLSILASIVMPRRYLVEMKVLVQKNQMLTALVNPDRLPRDSENPLQFAVETIKSNENLVNLVKQANLIDAYFAQRTSFAKWKDDMMTRIGTPPKEEDRIRALTAMLDASLNVSADNSVLTISVKWGTPETAFRLVSLVERNFIDARRASEVASISDAIDLLQKHANEQRERIDAAVEDIQRARQARLAALGAGADAQLMDDVKPTGDAGVAAAPYRPMRLAAIPAEATELSERLRETRRQIKAMEDEHARKLQQDQAALADLLTTFAPAHPMVVAAERKLEFDKQEPSELINLRNKERDLVGQLAIANTKPVLLPAPSPAASAVPTNPAAPPRDPGRQLPVRSNTEEGSSRTEVVDPEMALLRSRLEEASRKFDDTMGRMEIARRELDAAQAVFKNRYFVLSPPELPRRPQKPEPWLVVLGGIVASLLFGILFPAAKDFLSGRVVEPWQAGRAGLPILAQLRLPKDERAVRPRAR